MKKTIIKFLIISILILGVYYSTSVRPVEEKRVENTISNFKNQQSFGFEATGSLESGRNGFYDLQIKAHKQKQAIQGDFILTTNIEGSSQDIEGEFIHEDQDLFLLFESEGLPITLESFFEENYDKKIEDIRNQWVRIDAGLSFLDNFEITEEEMETISEEEEIKDEEVYHYKVNIFNQELFKENISMELFTGKRDLILHKLIIDDNFSLAESLDFPKPFVSFIAGSSPTLSLSINFYDFNQEKEILTPIEFLDL